MRWVITMAKSKLDDNEKERVELAIKWVRSLKKLPKIGFYLLLRPGSIGGVVYDKYGKMVDGYYRTVIKYIDYAEEKPREEFLDYKPDPVAEPEDCQPLYFRGYPIILTSRIRPGFDDDIDSFEWLVTGWRARHIQNMHDDIVRKDQEIGELNHQLELTRGVIKRLKRENETLAERLRNLESEVMALSTENINLKDENRRKKIELLQWMAAAEMATSAVEYMLRVSDKAGVEWVMGARDKLDELLRRTKNAMELVYSSIGDVNMGEDIRRHLNKLERHINLISDKLEYIRTNGGKEEAETATEP